MVNSQEHTDVYRFKGWVVILLPMVALFLQAYLPLLLPGAAMLDFALLATLYFAFGRRNQAAGLLLGAVIGLVQDSLGPGPIGVFGMVKTLIGYAASSLGVRLDVENPLTRLLLVFAFYYIHLGLFLGLERFLLERAVNPPGLDSVVAALVNAIAGVVIFQLLDRLRQRE